MQGLNKTSSDLRLAPSALVRDDFLLVPSPTHTTSLKHAKPLLRMMSCLLCLHLLPACTPPTTISSTTPRATHLTATSSATKSSPVAPPAASDTEATKTKTAKTPSTTTPEQADASATAQVAKEQADKLAKAIEEKNRRAAEINNATSQEVPEVKWLDTRKLRPTANSSPSATAINTSSTSAPPTTASPTTTAGNANKSVPTKESTASPTLLKTASSPDMTGAISGISNKKNANREAAGSEPPIAQRNASPENASEAANREPSAAKVIRQRNELLQQLRAALWQSSNPSLRQAVAVAGLSLTEPQRKLPAEELADLEPWQRDLIEKYHGLVVTLGKQLEQKDPSVTQESVNKLLEGLLGPLPLKIRNIQLCKRVKGYGVYDPFEENRFVAGKLQRAIIYIEVENFQSEKTISLNNKETSSKAGNYQVKLQQEVSIRATGESTTEVWRQPPAKIVDESRNQRRDFFLVHLIEIPVTLPAGKYLLKVRVTDQTNQSVDEALVPFVLTPANG